MGWIGRPSLVPFTRVGGVSQGLVIMAVQPVNIPNLITLGRAVLVPIVFWLVLAGEDAIAFFLFVIAGVSDAVDGYLARRYDLHTEIGAYLDPLADKLLIVSIFVGLGLRSVLPDWLVYTVVGRDLLILGAIVLSWLLSKPVAIAPLMISKVTTVAQISLAALVLADEAFSLGIGMLRTGLIWFTAGLTIASLLAYFRIWIVHMSRN
jgi:cardiolipin synthase (CMP-forming)